MKTNIVGFKELREDADKYIAQVQKGRSFVVVRRSKPIFKMVPVDEWGDEGVWETVADFRTLHPKGVPATDVLRVLKKLRG
ncbi:MAG: type II toxin-antitoxin system prevent-host-death family antitoxin [Patescibacteria group bacterium]